MNIQDDEFFKKLLSTFKVESKERIQNMSTSLLELEKEQEKTRQASLIELIYREIHSLKSAARSVDLTYIENICNALESVFSAWKKDKTMPTPQQFDLLHNACDSIEHLLDASDLKKTSPDKQDSKILHALENLSENPSAPSAVEHELTKEKPSDPNLKKPSKLEETVRISTKKLDALLIQAEEMLTTKLNLMQRLNDLLELKNELDAETKEREKLTQEKIALRKHFKKKLEDSKNIISPHLKFLDFFESSEKRFKIFSNHLDSLSGALDRDFHVFSNGVDTLLEDTKKLLMWPFSTLLNTLPRIVRDLARSQEKDVNFILQGGEIEIDKRILEEMKDVLLHIIRNAIDHGLEKPSDRKKLNKPEQGILKINIQQLTGNEILVEIIDDGSGINLEKVKLSAIKEGILTPEESQKISVEDALNLIYQSGISTSPILTELSGRGLGMTIIREKNRKDSWKNIACEHC